MEGNQQQVKKRHPGRPSIRPKKENIALLGIIDKQQKNPENIIEMIHYDIVFFKDLLSFFKSLHSYSLFIRWSKETVTFFIYDHDKNSRICVKINADKLGSYYYGLDEPLTIRIAWDEISSIFSSIDRSFGSIMFSQQNANSLYITLHDNDLRMNCEFTILVKNEFVFDRTLFEIERSLELENIRISFELSTIRFKKSIVDISNCSKGMLITKSLSSNYLEISHPNKASSFCCSEKYDDNGPINLHINFSRSDMGIYRSSIFPIKLLKPIINNIPVDKLCFFCADDEIIFRGISAYGLCEILFSVSPKKYSNSE